VQQALGIERVYLLPVHIPPHRHSLVATPAQRLAMLKRAIEREPALSVDTRELDRPGPSYMVDTLRSVRTQVGNEPVTLVVGIDAFNSLESWYEWRTIGELAHLLVLERPGGSWPQQGELAEWAASARVDDYAALFEQPAGRVASLRVSQLEISSTHIRQLFRDKQNARYLLPDGVLDLILKNGWYSHD
jgi:nicotinate-nucleotide adenylyltransferase